jgi:hypothetical protein
MRVGMYRPVHVKTLASQKRRMLLTSRQLLQAKALDILLGPDVNIVHGCSASADEIRMVKAFLRTSKFGYQKPRSLGK